MMIYEHLRITENRCIKHYTHTKGDLKSRLMWINLFVSVDKKLIAMLCKTKCKCKCLKVCGVLKLSRIK